MPAARVGRPCVLFLFSPSRPLPAKYFTRSSSRCSPRSFRTSRSRALRGSYSGSEMYTIVFVVCTCLAFAITARCHGVTHACQYDHMRSRPPHFVSTPHQHCNDVHPRILVLHVVLSHTSKVNVWTTCRGLCEECKFVSNFCISQFSFLLQAHADGYPTIACQQLSDGTSHASHDATDYRMSHVFD